MRCLACNVRLTEFEETVKYASDNTFVDLCNRCRGDLPSSILLVERGDLQSNEDISDLDIEADDYYG